jgi:hypothetical protein
MPIDKFKFVSPGVQVAEIDNSQLPDTPAEVGPVIVGRASRGPGLRPVQVNSMSEFVEIFGNPVPGGETQDAWRNPDAVATAYGSYAAQAYLRNSSPITYVRLLGDASPNNAGDGADGTAAANGGAGWKAGVTPTAAAVGGAFGLFVFNSGSATFNSTEGNSTPTTGALAAIIYATTGSFQLSGTIGGSGIAGQATNIVAKTDSDGNFTLKYISSVSGDVGSVNPYSNSTANESIIINLNRTSKNYIRNVMNTNPTRTNSNITTAAETYFLGETFDTMVDQYATTTELYGVLLPLASGSVIQNSQLRSSKAARSGWIISQHIGTRSDFNPVEKQKLFRFVAHSGGEDISQDFKISIRDITAPTNELTEYGTFTVEIRRASDSDAAPQVVEVFPLCNLNPASDNYIAKKIGDKYVSWNNDKNYYDEYGDYPNRSKYVYVEINDDVRRGIVSNQLLPFGFIGPVEHTGFSIASSGSTPLVFGGELESTANTNVFVSTSGSIPTKVGIGTSNYAYGGDINGHFTASFNFPSIRTRTQSSEGDLASPKDAYFGITTGRVNAFDTYDPSYVDTVRCLPDGYSDQDGAADGNFKPYNPVGSTTGDLVHSFVFSLDDLKLTGSGEAYWASGTMAAGQSVNSGSYNECLKLEFNKFTMPLIGGFDGLNITEAEPFNNTRALASDKSDTTSYAVYSAKKAFNTVADPEVVQSNMMAIPGVTATSVQNHMIKICENRADSLAIVDLAGDYNSIWESKESISSRAGNVQTTIDNLNARALNTSYAAAYYPYVRVADSETGGDLWVPPSVPAIGTLSSAQRNSELWFAPAGFTRGGLTEGAAGIPVVSVAQRLRQKDRDDLYAANINPIATFPAEGIVIFGQKTLQVTPSALDRINVRRLMIYVKREISFIASRLLFEQNVQATWDRFTGQVTPFLDSIVARQGLMDYRVILDETTTTPDLVDRNTIYAKIFLKPAKAVEFIAIDFVITRSGASFED